MQRPAIRRLTLLALAASAAGLRAQDQPPARPERPIPVDVAAEQRGAPVRELTLEEALRLGRRQNVSLRAAELLPAQARMDLLFAEAGFQPEIYGSSGYAETQQPQRNAFQPSLTRQTIDAQLGWRQRVATGGLFDLAFRPARLDTNAQGGFFPREQFTSEWLASYRQPLLRGGWSDANLADINSARYQWNRARHQFDRTVQDTLLAIVEAYWELAFARENWRVVATALEVAEEQLRITDERIRVQQLAPLDRVADEAEVARRREELITAENAIRAREDALRRQLVDATDGAVWQINLRPVSPIAIEPQPVARAVEPLVEVAIASRPDLRSLRSAVATAEVDLARAENAVLPSLDLVGSYSSDGVRDRFDDSFRDAVDQQYPDWSLRLEFSVPVGNQAARARQQRAALEVERQRRQLHALTLEVTTQVRDAVRSLETLTQSVRASAESVRLATTNLRTEQIKLQVGSSTPFEVQRRNQELREARSRHLRNQLDYHLAESRLLHAQGLLETPP